MFLYLLTHNDHIGLCYVPSYGAVCEPKPYTVGGLGGNRPIIYYTLYGSSLVLPLHRMWTADERKGVIISMDLFNMEICLLIISIALSRKG